MCSRHVNDVAVNATPSSVTIEPSTMVGRRSRARSGITTTAGRVVGAR